MHTRTGPDYPPGMLEKFTAIRGAEGDQITTGRFPVGNVNEAWELYSMLGITVPGIQHGPPSPRTGRSPSSADAGR